MNSLRKTTIIYSMHSFEHLESHLKVISKPHRFL